jgi:hypothetical protein
MIRRLLFIALFSLFSLADSQAQSLRASSSTTVIEPGARAHFLENSIRFELPLAASAGPGVHATIWILAPDGKRSGVTAVDVHEGSAKIIAIVPRPTEPDGKPVVKLDWYRIAYSVQAPGAAATEGIVALAVVAPNAMELRLVRPAYPETGHPIEVRVYACNPVTKSPLGNVHLTGTLEVEAASSAEEKRSKSTVVREGTTDETGETWLRFPKKSAAIESVTIQVHGVLMDEGGGQAEATIESELTQWDRASIHIETDKPLHKPGETVHLRALVFHDGAAVPNAAFTMTIKDPEEKVVAAVPLTTNRFGIVAYDWKTNEHVAVGDYTVRVGDGEDSEHSNYQTEQIPIRRYELPEFAVQVRTDRGAYLDGQSAVVRIHAGYLFGKPVSAGSVRLGLADDHEWNPKTREWDKSDKPEQSATLDSNGDAELRLDLKDKFEDFKDRDYERYEDLDYRAIVTDPRSGRSEPRKFLVRLTHDPVHIYIRLLGGSDKEGEFLVTANAAEGGPVARKVTLDWVDDDSHATRAATVTTNQYGLGKVHLRCPARSDGSCGHEYKIRLAVREPNGRASSFDDTLYLDPTNAWFSVSRSLLKPNQPIEAILHASKGTTLDVQVHSRDGLIKQWQTHMKSGIEPVNLEANSAFHGLITLSACEIKTMASTMWRGPCAYKSVLYPQDRALKVKLEGLRPSYAPGAEVLAGLNLHGVAGVLGVSVFDTAVEQRSTTENEENDRSRSAGWWQDDSNVSGMTEEDLNSIDMSQPTPDGLDLVAEALIGRSAVQTWWVTTNEDDDEEHIYQSQMEASLKPLGVAVIAARLPHFPANLEELRSLARARGLSDALLKDSWDTPYKPSTAVDGSVEVLKLISAGPDKKFGTNDDFELELAQRNVFAAAGDRLTELLRKAVASGHPLPGTVEGLKQLAHDGGLDLVSQADATLDRNGNPYRYAISVWGRFYSVQVYEHEQSEKPVNPADDWNIWNSPAIDYFARTEARLSSAIESWEAAGNLFPETEAEARRAFAAAGIDFDALHDPLGKPLKLWVGQVTNYSRVESVKAAESVQSKTIFATHQMRAVQVLRQSESDGSRVIREAIAQFLHPISEQSGADLKPRPVLEGVFNGNTGAIGGTVTDQTGAIVAGANVKVTNAFGELIATVNTQADGTYLVHELTPGLMTVEVSAKGFEVFLIHEVLISSASLTSVDVQLNVGAESTTVTVEADAIPVQTDSSAVSAIVAGQTGRVRISSPTFTPRLRHVFEETAYWSPSLETSATGRAHLHFTLPDSLTTWKLHALASTTDGRVGVLDRTFKTFQPFFVDLDAPLVLTVGDEITLPVNLRNYTSKPISLPVTLKPADWISPLTPAKVDATVPSNGTAPVTFGFRATKAVETGPLNINAANAHEGDAVEKTVRVHPDGEPRAVAVSELLRGRSTSMALDLPADTVPGSIHAELRLYPNLGAHLLQSIKAVLERPYGCGEQTLSSTYPSLLFLELLKEAKTGSPAESEAKDYLQLGYDRLLGYFGTGGGLTYWGKSEEAPDPALTAYGIEFLTEAEPYVPVDQRRIVDSVNWLVSNQQADGSWKPHYGATSAGLNLYVAAVLARTLAANEPVTVLSPDLRERAKKAVKLAAKWAANSAAAVHDPYANALRLRLGPEGANPAALRAELVNEASQDRYGVHWSSQNSSPFYGWGHAGDLETTALVVGALNQSSAFGGDASAVNDGLLYLLRNQDRYGIWYSGQATVRVLQALLPMAIAQLRAPMGSSEIHLSINGVALSQQEEEALRADAKLLEAPRTMDLTALLKAESNTLELTSTSDAALASVEASASFYVPWQGNRTPERAKTQTGTDFGLDFGSSCNAADARVGQPVNCTVDVRRFGSGGYGMLLAEVGLPPGADVDRASLGKLLDNWEISRYELQPDRVVFYLWSWKAEGEHLGFSFTPRYPIRAKAAPSTLSDYYNPDVKVVLAPQTYTVSDRMSK